MTISPVLFNVTLLREPLKLFKIREIESSLPLHTSTTVVVLDLTMSL